MESGHAIALTISYDGAPFAGFARQPGLPTVQGKLESALQTILGRAVETTGAGRTDSGVHALRQVVSFSVTPDDAVDDARLLRSLNALTGEGIVIREVRRAREGFSARFDATGREYRYRIAQGPVPPLFLARFAWHVSAPMNEEAIRAGAGLLVGEHDFRSFCVSESAEGQRTIRHIDAIDVEAEEHLGERCLTIRVSGNAFLHSMIRVIAGTLVEVGVGRRDVGWVGEALEAERREAAGPTAPPHGLTFWRVRYPDDVWL